MTFPDSPLGLRAELLVGGQGWTDITSKLYTRDPMSITYGMSAEGTQVDPGSYTMTINNRAGEFSPRNPLSPYYGRIGRNTPLRLSVPRPDGESYLNLTGAGGGASTPDASVLHTTAAFDARLEGTFDWRRGTLTSLIGKWEPTGDERSWVVLMGLGNLIVLWSSDGSVNSALQASALLPRNLPRRAALRVSVEIGTASVIVRMYWATSLDGPWQQFSDDSLLSFPAVTSIYTSTAPLAIGPDLTADPISTPRVQLPIGDVRRAEVRNLASGAVIAAPDFRTVAAGADGFVDSAGLPWIVQAPATVDDRAYLAVGEVSSWPPRWSTSEKDAWVPIEAAGILRRLGQGRKPLDSTLRRRIPSAPGLLAYWPMEDGAGATAASSAIPGVPAAKATGFSWASESTLGGSSPLPTLGNPASLSATVPRAATSGWQVELVYRLTEMPTTDTEILRVTLSDSTIRTITVAVSTAGVHVRSLDVDNAQLGSVTYTDPTALAGFVGTWNRLALFTSPVTSSSAGEITVTAAWRDVTSDTYWYALNTPTASQMGRVAAISGTWADAVQGMALGHLSVVSVPGAATRQGSTIYEGADDGFVGEHALDRMDRLAIETGLPLITIDGDGTIGSEAMGAQAPAEVLDLVADAAAADGGILFEDPARLGLLYRDRQTLANQEPGLVLDYAAREIAPPLEPVDDDQTIRNDVTVSRPGGGSGRVVVEEGPLSVLPPEEGGVGVYDTSETVNLGSDDRTLQVAGWLAHLGTWDEPRYPSVTVNLHRNPQLIEQVLALRIGDMIRIVNPPAYTGPGPVDLIVRQVKHTPLPRTWVVTFVCTPAGPWNVGELPQQIVETFESDVPVLPHTDGGDAPWARVSGIFGGWSLGSGHITDEQHSDAIFTMPDGAVGLSFQYLISSEEGGPDWVGDQFQVFIDDALVLTDQGGQPVKTATFPVRPGSRVVFRYVKDDSTAEGLDHAYINDLTVELVDGGAVPRVDTGGSELTGAVDEDATTFPVTTTGLALWVDSATYPDEFPFDVRVGGEVVTVTAIGGEIQDSFGRTVTSGWGSADTGQTWTTSGGSTADYSVQGV